MSATIPNSKRTQPPATVIWSRGGDSLRRLIWKEASEVASFWIMMAILTLVSSVGLRPQDLRSLSIIWLHAAPVLFALGFGSRSFAHEFEQGTWHLLRSLAATASEVLLSKLLVGACGSLLLVGLSVTCGGGILPLTGNVGESTLWLIGLALLTLAVSMQISLWTQAVLRSVVISTAVLFPIWNEWVKLGCSLVGWTPQSAASLPALLLAIPVSVGLWQWQWYLVGKKLLNTNEVGFTRQWRRVFWRMLWKELLTVRDFWLAVLGIVILFDVGAYSLFRQQETREIAIVSLGVLMPWLHALGCGAISFSLEREDGTQDWLRRISARASAVFAAKLLVTQASIWSLTGLVLLGTHYAVSPANQLRMDALLLMLLAVMLNGLVALGASLLTRRVLPAMFLAFLGIAVIDAPLLAVGLNSLNVHNPIRGTPLAILPWWLLVCLILIVCEWRLADRWLNERRWWPRRWHGQLPPAQLSPQDESWFDWRSSPEDKALGRHLWREWNEAKGWLWALPLVFVPSLNLDMLDIARAHRSAAVSIMKGVLIPACTILSVGLCALPTLLGVWAYHHDQRQGVFRFLGDRGASPQRIWFSKQAVWLTLVLLLAGLAGTITELQSSISLRGPLFSGSLTGFALIFALQSFAAGQALSQWNRSALIAMFLASLLSLLLWGWALLLAQELRAPWPYQLGAAAILFFASWMRSRDWLEDRWTWRAWLRIVLSTVLPFAALVVGLEVQGYSVWEKLRDLPAFR